jgi:hypothetical protein
MGHDSSIAGLKKRAQKALRKSSEDRTYKEVKDISSWRAVTERGAAMEGNQYASGLVRTEKNPEKMRSSQRMRRVMEFIQTSRSFLYLLAFPFVSRF